MSRVRAPFLGICYALPAVSMAMLWTPLNVMQGLYVTRYRLSMGVLAGILLASRVYDAGADIFVGAISDRLKARTGSRKSLFAIGAVLFATAGVLVYVPPDPLTPYYLTFWLFAFFTGYATLTIPHLAWGAELAPESNDKTRIFGLRTAAGYCGLCLFYAAPLLPVFASTEITPETIKFAVYLAIGLLLPAVTLSLIVVPGAGTRTTAEGDGSIFTRGGLCALAANRPFLVFVGAFLLCGIGLGMWYGMIFIFVDVYLQRGGLFAPLYLASFVVGALASFGWSRLAVKLGKKMAWSMGMTVALITVFATGFLTPKNVTPWALGSVLIANTVGFVSLELLPGAILGDIADYSRLRSGRNQTALYFSCHMFLTKVFAALGSAVGLALAAYLGFRANAGAQDQHGVFALAVVMSWVPGALLAGALLVIRLIPMDERRHAIVRKRLDQRDLRARSQGANVRGLAAGHRESAAICEVCPTGEWVEVNGRRVHVVRRGAASRGFPTVILEAGCGWHSAMYAWIIEALARQTCVIAYDRAGLGWTSATRVSADGESRASELRALIQTLELRGPYVLIGHSIAALYLRIYARRFPLDVAALVFLDPTHTLVYRIFSSRTPVSERLQTRLALYGHALGIKRVPFPLLRTEEPPWNTLPPAARQIIRYLSANTHEAAATRAERAMLAITSQQTIACGSLGDLPLLVITGGVRMPEELSHVRDPDSLMEKWMVLQKDLVSLSSRGIHRIIEGAGHCNMITDKNHAEGVCTEVFRFLATTAAIDRQSRRV